MNNKVIIRPDDDSTEINGVLISDNHSIQRHYAVTGTVVDVPDNLVCDHERYFELNNKINSHRELIELQDIHNRSLPWLPKMELKVGDRVAFVWTNQINRDETDNQAILVLNYTDIFCKIVDGLPVPINGFILVSPTSDTEGVVKYTSAFLNEGYLSERISHEEDNIKVSDNILFTKNKYWIIDDMLYSSFKTGETLWAMFRKDILIVR